jgi:hypothetical protein
MATKWQRSCLEALIESPEAFKVFKAKQINRKMLDQFVCKLWPYKYKKANNIRIKSISGKKEHTLQYVFRELANAINTIDCTTNDNQDEILLGCRDMYFNADQIYEQMCEIESRAEDNMFDGCGDMFSIIAIGENGRDAKRIYDPNSSGQRNIITRIKMLASDIRGSGAERMRFLAIRKESTNRSVSDMLAARVYCFNTLMTILGPAPKKVSILERKQIEYDSVNIGIEIEYNGCNCQPIGKKLAQLEAVEFNSGWDGGSQDGNDYKSGTLRENRLRIKGLRGIRALNELLIYMVRNGCAIDNNSGLHVHVDCRDMDLRNNKKDFSYVLTAMKERMAKDMKSMSQEAKDDIITILRMSTHLRSYNKLAEEIIPRVNIQCSFKTLEWRMLYPTLVYETMMPQILLVIHLTECAKYKNKKPNEAYIHMLGEIVRKQDNQNLPVRQNY